MNVCFYFQVHQPFRLREYSLFDWQEIASMSEQVRSLSNMSSEELYVLALAATVPIEALEDPTAISELQPFFEPTASFDKRKRRKDKNNDQPQDIADGTGGYRGSNTGSERAKQPDQQKSIARVAPTPGRDEQPRVK